MSMGTPRGLYFRELFGGNACFMPSFPGKQNSLHKTDTFSDTLPALHNWSSNFDQFLNLPVGVKSWEV